MGCGAQPRQARWAVRTQPRFQPAYNNICPTTRSPQTFVDRPKHSAVFLGMEPEGFGTDPVVVDETAAHAATGTYTTTSAPAHAETNDDAYVYEALATDRPRIRLITVWQGVRRASYPYPPTDSDEILCTIDAFEVDKAPSYIALSYTWGDPIPLHTIRLNGRHFSIRENLFDFLKAFGASDIGQQKHYLWIDQLCIDQSNTGERNHQVSMMADIYRNGQFVISWLDRSCFEAFHDLATGHLDFDEQYLRMITIFSNQYFSRLWVVQEVLLAKDVKFMCGDVSIGYGVLKQHSQTLKWRIPSAECDNAHSLFQTKDSLAGNSMNLVYVLNHGGSVLKCGDGRDQVYGLLGIVGSSQHVPEVNYQDSVQQVYLDTIRIILTEGQNQVASLTIDCAKRLGENMFLSHGHLVATHTLLDDIRMRAIYGVTLYTPPRPIIHAIGVDPPESPVEWWYEHQGLRYSFPVQSDADQSSQNSSYSRSQQHGAT